MRSVRILAPTGCLGGGFGPAALGRGMTLRPSVIAVDSGSSEPGPSFLGSGSPLFSERIIKKELAAIVQAARKQPRASRVLEVRGSAFALRAREPVCAARTTTGT